jgi:hypothetical protein
MDKRRLAVIAVIAAFMVVPIAHVAAYTGSLERDGWQWVGWFYAAGVDVSIATCAWFTRWKTTRAMGRAGYVLFGLMDGVFNVGYIKPWEKETPIAAWTYAIFPTLAVIWLGLLARSVDALADSKRKRGGIMGAVGRLLGEEAPQPAPKPSYTCDHCGASFDKSNGLSAHLRWCEAYQAQKKGANDD